MPQTLNIESFDPLAWANAYTQTAMPIHGAVVEPILHFSLMWNLFERDACGKEASRTKIGAIVSSAASAGLLSLEPFAEHLTFFQGRAQREGMEIKQYLNALKMENEKDRHLVHEVLDDRTNEPKKVVHALLLIAHRVRNNLFHGEKEVAYLHAQVSLFRAVNSLIATYLTVTKSAA